MTQEQIQGWFDFEELYSLAAERASDGSILVELGPWLGRSTAFLGLKLLELGKSNCQVHAIDTFEGTPGEEVFETLKLQDTRSILQRFEENMRELGISGIVRTVVSDSIEASRQYPDESVEFVFFDTEHTYSHLSEELKAWIPKLKRGSIYGGHDLFIEDVQKAVAEFVPGWKTMGSCWSAQTTI